ncbi:unnamed protein product [Caenorhabditis nigoni]
MISVAVLIVIITEHNRMILGDLVNAKNIIKALNTTPTIEKIVCITSYNIFLTNEQTPPILIIISSNDY